VSFGGRFYDRTGVGPDSGAFYSHNTFWAKEVDVPQNGGRTIVIDTRAVYQDTRGTRLDGNVFLFDARVPGTTTFALADGTVILRDAGVVKQVYTIDTLGDGTPGGDDFQMLSYTWAGPHPGEDADLCAMFRAHVSGVRSPDRTPASSTPSGPHERARARGLRITIRTSASTAGLPIRAKPAMRSPAARADEFDLVATLVCRAAASRHLGTSLQRRSSRC
jgi:hypothetical protein